MRDYQDDIRYTAALIEYTARKTKNKRSFVAEKMGTEGIRKCFHFADVNHCLPMEQVADETIEQYCIPNGSFDPESNAKHPPSYIGIGKNYANIVIGIETDPEKYPDELYKVLTSKISEWMTDYRSAFYYSPTDYMLYEYKALLPNA